MESQLSVLIEDMGKLKRLSVSGEGTVATLQGRQDRLDVKVYVSNKNCMLALNARDSKPG